MNLDPNWHSKNASQKTNMTTCVETENIEDDALSVRLNNSYDTVHQQRKLIFSNQMNKVSSTRKQLEFMNKIMQNR